MNHRKFAWIAVLIPFFVLAAAVIRAEHQRRRGSQWTLPIRGHDPRDLLRGRFLQFRFDYDITRDACTGKHCCVCRPQGGHPRGAALPTRPCAIAKTQCDDWLPEGNLEKPMRFFVPEDRAAPLERALIDAGQQGEAEAVFVLDTAQRPQFLRLRLGALVVDALEP